MRLTLLLFVTLLISRAVAAQVLLGYGIVKQMPTDPVPHADSGLELRLLWGTEDADRWSIWLGAQPERRTAMGAAYGFYVNEIPSYYYVAGLRRFNLHLDGHRTLFAGTGLGYRDIETCLDNAGIRPPPCFDGDPFVSSKWAFAQELGFRWRIVELSVGHLSTGGISRSNKGVNLIRFTLLAKIGGDK